MIKVLRDLCRPSALPGGPAITSHLIATASAALSTSAILQQACHRDRSQAGLLVPSIARRHVGIAAAVNGSVQQPQTGPRNCGMSSYAPAAFSKAAAPAADVRTHSHSDGSAGATPQQSSRAGDSKLTPWQQLRNPRSNAVKRKPTASMGRQEQLAKTAKRPSTSNPAQQQKKATPNGQLGKKGLNDLGLGAEVHYVPSLFDGKQAAQMLTALQVMALSRPM